MAAAPARQQTSAAVADFPFTYEEVMVPMRDGAKLQTVIIRPSGKTGKLPILLQRTPYGVPGAAALERCPRRWRFLMEDGYILVFQNMRGQFKSDGDFTMSMALDAKGKKQVDEATDAYDTIDWLVKNVADNNGKVGMWGVSYPGYAAGSRARPPAPGAQGGQPAGGVERLVDQRRSPPLRRDAAVLRHRLAVQPAEQRQGRRFRLWRHDASRHL